MQDFETERLPAPDFLNAKQQEIWGHVVGSVPTTHFGPQHEALLVSYVTSAEQLLVLSIFEAGQIQERGEGWFATEEADRISLRRARLAENVTAFTQVLGLALSTEQKILDYTRLKRDFVQSVPSAKSARH